MTSYYKNANLSKGNNKNRWNLGQNTANEIVILKYDD